MQAFCLQMGGVAAGSKPLHKTLSTTHLAGFRSIPNRGRHAPPSTGAFPTASRMLSPRNGRDLGKFDGQNDVRQVLASSGGQNKTERFPHVPEVRQECNSMK